MRQKIADDYPYGFGLPKNGDFGLIVPFWLALLASCVAAGLAHRNLAANYRFSLRTLLIATTLVAVVLALGVWLAR